MSASATAATAKPINPIVCSFPYTRYQLACLMKASEYNRAELRGRVLEVSGINQGAAVSELVNGITKSRTGVKSVLKGYSFGRLIAKLSITGSGSRFQRKMLDSWRAPGGIESAYEELLARYQQTVYSMVYQIAWRPENDACDVVQEVFLKVFRSVGSFQERSSLRTWIYRIAVNELTITGAGSRGTEKMRWRLSRRTKNSALMVLRPILGRRR